MRRVIACNRYYSPDHSATSQLLSDLCMHLAAKGHAVHVITSRQRYDDAKAHLSSRQSIGGVEVHRVWTSSFGRQNLVLRAIDYLTFYLSAFAEGLRVVKRGDILIAKTDPPVISLVAWAVARLKGAALVNWTQDLYPEVPLALGMKSFRYFAWLMIWMRNRSLIDSRLNVVIGERMARTVAQLGAPEDRIRIVHNWADGHAIRPLPPSENPLRKKWGLDGQFVVGYSGNFGRVHDFETIIGAIRQLRQVRDISFLFIGGGAQHRRLMGELESVCAYTGKSGGHDCKNVIFKPYQSRESLGQSLNVANVHLVSLLPALEGLIVPSKFYGIAAAGKPTLFIGDVDGEIPRILREDPSCGMAIRFGDVQGLVDAILLLKGDPSLAASMGTNARRRFESEFDRSVALAEWERLLRQP